MDLITVGDIFIDLIMTGIPQMPEMGGKALASEFCREIGGGAFITAHGLARLGFQAGMLVCVGEKDSQWLLDRAAHLGVEVSFVQKHPSEQTGVTVSISTKEDRAFFSFRGANNGCSLEEFPPSRFVHVTTTMDRIPKPEGTFVSLDVGWDPEWFGRPEIWDLLRNIDLFFPNEKEGEELTGQKEPEKMLLVFQEKGLSRVALKLGTEGAALLWDGKYYNAKPPKVKTKDTTGAGDSFDAGFLAALLQGAGPQECLESAVFCGAMAARHLGGVTGFPSQEEWNQRKEKSNQ